MTLLGYGVQTTSSEGEVGSDLASLRIRPGDTLWNIARSHQISLHNLLRLNPALRSHPQYVYAGEVIAIPDHEQAGSRSTVRSAAVPERVASFQPASDRFERVSGDRREFTAAGRSQVSARYRAAIQPAKKCSARELPGGPQVRRWAPDICQASESTGVPAPYIAAVMTQESHGTPGLRSSAGAIGLMQLMPDTARGLGVNPYNSSQNILGGARYLRQLLGTFRGNLKLALAAYNAGPGAVQRYGTVPPYRQTRTYVRDILADLKKIL